MKTLYLAIVCIIISISGFAQDTLFTREGKIINCNVIDGTSIPNQPVEKTFDSQAKANEYAQKVARQEAVADAVFVGIRVVGFILRVALEIASAGSCHSGGHNYHGNYGTNHPRGH